jgi:hypothetical protein
MDWQAIPQKRRDDVWIKGTEIDRAFPEGFRHRFAIISVRTIGRDKGGMTYDVLYRVRDAEAANDQHFKDGKPAPIFGEYATLELALAAIEPHRIVEESY